GGRDVAFGKGDELAAAGLLVLELPKPVHARAETRPWDIVQGVLDRVAPKEAVISFAKIFVDPNLPVVHPLPGILCVVAVGTVVQRKKGPYGLVHGYGAADQPCAIGRGHAVVRAVGIALCDSARPVGHTRSRNTLSEYRVSLHLPQAFVNPPKKRLVFPD